MNARSWNPLGWSLLVGLLGSFGPSLAIGAPVAPTSYDMLNGVSPGSNTRHYWDRKYNGSGNTTQDAAPLTGGLGDLTDGIVASGKWSVVELIDDNPGTLEPTDGTGPYVGWRREGLSPPERNVPNPKITFRFANQIRFDTVRVHYDNDSDVFSPATIGVKVGSASSLFPIDSGLPGPRWADLDVSSLNMTGDALELTLNHRGVWVHISEVSFAGSVVPEPAACVLAGLASLAWSLRRRRS